MANKQAIAAWEKKEGSNQTLFLALPSSSGKGEYLIGISLLKQDTIIIAHQCPARKMNKWCWHEETALELFKKWLWWKDLSDHRVSCINRKITLNPNWIQIPIPGQPLSFGKGWRERRHAS